MKTIQEKQQYTKNVEHGANVHFSFECYRFVGLVKQISLIEFYEPLFCFFYE